MTSFISPRYGRYANYGAFTIGLISLGNGVNALLRPESAHTMLRFPAPSDLEARKLTRSLIYLYGARDVSLGLTVLSLGYNGYHEPLGWVSLAAIPSVVVDGLASRYQTGGGE